MALSPAWPLASAVGAVSMAAQHAPSVKGAGEGGCTGIGVPIASAVADALGRSAPVDTISLSPRRLRDLLALRIRHDEHHPHADFLGASGEAFARRSLGAGYD